MKKLELIKGITYLSTAYKKEYNNQELELIYNFIKDFNYETFIKAIKNIIKKEKFLPTISQIINELNIADKDEKNEIIDKMKLNGYFKNPKEIDKIYQWLNEGIIPKWFKKDMELYNKPKRLTNDKNLLDILKKEE